MLLFSFSAQANLKCSELFRLDMEVLGEIEAIFALQDDVRDAIRTVNPTTHDFKFREEKLKVGDLVVIKVREGKDYVFSPIEGIVLGTRIMLDTASGLSKVFLVVYAEADEMVFHLTREMIDIKNSEIVGHKYDKFNKDPLEALEPTNLDYDARNIGPTLH